MMACMILTSLDYNYTCEITSCRWQSVTVVKDNAQLSFFCFVKDLEMTPVFFCRAKGKRYFTCPPSHGSMLRPDKVKVMIIFLPCSHQKF